MPLRFCEFLQRARGFNPFKPCLELAGRGAPGRARAAPLPPRGGPCSSGLIRPALLTQETGRRGPLSVPNRCPLSRFPRTCPAPRACARRPRPDALFARTAGGRLVAEALSEVLPGPLCLAGAVSRRCRRRRRCPSTRTACLLGRHKIANKRTCA